MLRKMPQRMAGSMPEVVKAVVVKLACAESSPLITSLLVVLAQLVHVSTQHFLDFLASQPGQGICFSEPCLPCWMQHYKVRLPSQDKVYASLSPVCSAGCSTARF